LTPVRWLILIASLAGLYAGIAVTAWCFGHLVPQQLHSVVLTAFTGGIIVAVVDSWSARRDRIVLAKLDELLFRHVCWMEATAKPVVAEVTGEIRPSSVYRASARVESPTAGVDSNVVVVAERLTRRLSAVVED
jgi:hypothetical protein